MLEYLKQEFPEYRISKQETTESDFYIINTVKNCLFIEYFSPDEIDENGIYLSTLFIENDYIESNENIEIQEIVKRAKQLLPLQ